MVRDSKQDWSIVSVVAVFAAAMVAWSLGTAVGKLRSDDCTTETTRDTSGSTITRTTCT